MRCAVASSIRPASRQAMSLRSLIRAQTNRLWRLGNTWCAVGVPKAKTPPRRGDGTALLARSADRLLQALTRHAGELARRLGIFGQRFVGHGDQPDFGERPALAPIGGPFGHELPEARDRIEMRLLDVTEHFARAGID